MSVFIDTNVIVYANLSSSYREPCLAILEAIARGHLDGRTSTAVLEEVWHLELSGRAGNLRGVARRAYELFTPLLAVSDEIVAAALDLASSSLGANDRVHWATAVDSGIAMIVSGDASFDGVRGLQRVDPLDRLALDRLVGSASQ